ncbi:NAD(P)-binding domain-containing protein [Actinokineospora auranticolor]|nr:NAD(P)-binding domain-containing protein [Actinokineospora auranticolor]
MKWIAGFPANTRDGLPRASAVLVLNDYATGYPIALLEAATISSARTAASAALAAAALGSAPAPVVGVVGAGVIARAILDHLVAAGVRPSAVRVHDLDERSGTALAEHARSVAPATFHADPTPVLAADVVVFATTAAAPHVREPFAPGQLVLDISLRDLPPEVLLAAHNVVDDVEHCLTANTSPHLTEQLLGHRDFIAGTLAQVRAGELELTPDRPVVFSPFGLGVLDIAVGAHVLTVARARGEAVEIPDFFGELTRW